MRAPFLTLAALALVLAACATRTAVVDELEATPRPLPDATAELPTEPAAIAGPVALALLDLGPAPEITNDIWLNTDTAVTLAALRGQKAVLVEFWTFG